MFDFKVAYLGDKKNEIHKKFIDFNNRNFRFFDG